MGPKVERKSRRITLEKQGNRHFIRLRVAPKPRGPLMEKSVREPTIPRIVK